MRIRINADWKAYVAAAGMAMAAWYAVPRAAEKTYEFHQWMHQPARIEQENTIPQQEPPVIHELDQRRYLAAGAYADPRRAKRLAVALIEHNYDAAISPTQTASGELTRVVVSLAAGQEQTLVKLCKQLGVQLQILDRQGGKEKFRSFEEKVEQTYQSLERRIEEDRTESSDNPHAKLYPFSENAVNTLAPKLGYTTPENVEKLKHFDRALLKAETLDGDQWAVSVKGAVGPKQVLYRDALNNLFGNDNRYHKDPKLSKEAKERLLKENMHYRSTRKLTASMKERLRRQRPDLFDLRVNFTEGAQRAINAVKKAQRIRYNMSPKTWVEHPISIEDIRLAAAIYNFGPTNVGNTLSSIPAATAWRKVHEGFKRFPEETKKYTAKVVDYISTRRPI